MFEVLLIEDDHADQLIFERHLMSTQEKINLTICNSLQEAFSHCESNDYHVIFCDYNLPDGSAQDFLANEALIEDSTVIVLTSQIDFRLAIETVKLGAYDFIAKTNLGPENLERLLSLARRNQKEKNLRAELENKLDENYGNTRAILDNSLDGTWLLAANGELLIINSLAKKTVYEYFDIKIKKGDIFFDKIPGKFNEDWSILFKKSLRGETGFSILEFEIDGLDYIFETRTNPIGPKEKILGVTFVVREISQRIRAEKQIRENERNFRSIFEGSEVPILLEDLETNLIVDLNSACADLHRYKVTEMIGMHIKDTIPVHYFDESQRNYQLHLLGKLDLLDSYLVTSDGKDIPVQISVTEITFQNKPTNLIFYQDISARKDTEKKLEEAKDLAEQTANFKSQFLANMSHEIRTPLNALLGFTDLLKETPLNTTQQEYINIIQKSGSNLIQIINDILDLSKMEAGKFSLRKEIFSLPDLLKNCTKLYEYKAKQKNIKLEFSYQKGLPEWVSSDEVRLSQILNNLINNALKFTEEGTVLIHASYEPINDTSFSCSFSVKDSGIGISKNEIDSIFEKFSQVDGSFQRKQKGTGLGLAIVAQLVDLFEGKLDVKSQINEGTTFSFTIPFIISKPPKTIKKLDSINLDLSHFRILVVEDNEINIMLIERVLAKIGCDFLVAKNGQEGIEKADSFHPNIILMDLQMPVLDGYEAARLILQKHTIPIYAMSAHVLEEERKKCLDIGMVGFIPKPFKIEQIYEVIQTNSPIERHELKTESNSFWKQINMPKLEELAGGDMDFTRDLFNIFITNVRHDLSELQNAHNANDESKIKSLAHKMKTSFATFEFSKAEDICDSIELGDSNDFSINELVSEGKRAISTVKLNLELSHQ